MVNLSPRARALIQAERSARYPSTADRDRVASALRPRLEPGSLPLEKPGFADHESEPRSGCFAVDGVWPRVSG